MRGALSSKIPARRRMYGRSLPSCRRYSNFKCNSGASQTRDRDRERRWRDCSSPWLDVLSGQYKRRWGCSKSSTLSSLRTFSVIQTMAQPAPTSDSPHTPPASPTWEDARNLAEPSATNPRNLVLCFDGTSNTFSDSVSLCRVPFATSSLNPRLGSSPTSQRCSPCSRRTPRSKCATTR